MIIFIYGNEKNRSMLFNSGKWHEQDRQNLKINQKISMIDRSIENSFSRLKNDISHINQWISYLHTSQDRNTESLNAINANMLTKEELRFFVDQHYQDMENLNNAVKTTMESTKNETQSYLNSVYTNQKDIFQRLQLLSDQVYSQSSSRQELKNDIIDSRQEIRDLKSEINSKIELKVRDQIQVVSRETTMSSLAPLQEEFHNFRREVDERLQNTVSKDVFDRLEGLNSRIENMNSSIGELKKKTDTKQNLKEKIFKKVTRHSKDYIKSMLLGYIKKYGKISGLQLREIVVEEQGLVSKSSFYRLLIELEEDESLNVIHEGKEKHYVFIETHNPQII